MSSTMPYLPIELYADIIKNLHHYRDRPTLLSAALVTKEWSKQSQRILFSKMTDHCLASVKREDNAVLQRHMGFLGSVAEHPRRLGPLVLTYAQHALAFNLEASKLMNLASQCTISQSILAQLRDLPSSRSDLWKLTARALPAMTNLKHLYLVPCADKLPATDKWVSSSTLFKSFTFQLETLVWAFRYHPDNGLTEFLKTQHSIIHFDGWRSRNGYTGLDVDVCPQLVSVSADFKFLSHAAQSRKIIAWRWYPGLFEPAIASQELSALDHLKYLSIFGYKLLRKTIGTIDLNITLLELLEGSWTINTFESLWNMPKLRVLAILLPPRRTDSDQEIWKKAVDSFKKLPSLEYIIQRDYRENGEGYRFVKLTLSPNSTKKLLKEELRIDYDIASPWWTVCNL